MKKLILLVAVLTGILLSCDLTARPEFTKVYNISDYTVSFELLNRETEKYTIKKGEEVSYKSGSHVTPTAYSPSKRVTRVHSGDWEYTFKNLEGFEVRGINGLGVAATLSADGWMENASITAATGEQIDSAWLVYTKSPRFSVVPDNEYKAVAVYEFVDDNDDDIKDTFKVTLQWSPNHP